jgi:hypothetical protein
MFIIIYHQYRVALHLFFVCLYVSVAYSKVCVLGVHIHMHQSGATEGAFWDIVVYIVSFFSLRDR